MRSFQMHDTEQNLNYIMASEAQISQTKKQQQQMRKNKFLCGKFVNVCLAKVEHQNVFNQRIPYIRPTETFFII